MLPSLICADRIPLVPNGGYVASVFQNVAKAHLAERGHPDTMIGHWEFLGRTKAAPAVLSVTEIKSGRSMSVLHISLHQDGLLPEFPWVSPSSKSEVNAYITNGNLSKEQGVTLPTDWRIPLPPPTPDFAALDKNKDKKWRRGYLPIQKFIHTIHNIEVYMPRSPSKRTIRGAHDFWIRMANGENFTTEGLGFVSDILSPVIVEEFRPKSEKAPVPKGGFPYTANFWYPTLVMNLDVKKNLPEDGAEWLRLRIAAKQILNGRFDIEFLIFDAQGDYVAGSHHVSLAVDSSRNYAKRDRPDTKL